MGKWWSVLFGVTMLACGLSFALGPFIGWGLPTGESEHSAPIDRLYYWILGVVGFFFFLTQALQTGFMYIYDADKKRPAVTSASGAKPSFFTEHNVEMAWSVVPAVILIVIAVAQINTWAEVKYLSRAPQIDGAKVPIQIAVSARQFEWRMRYPSSTRVEDWMNKPKDENVKKSYSSFGKHGQMDDVKDIPNELHIWANHPAMIHLTTRDVIHSFNLPHFRVKQDALPGRDIPLWFIPKRANTVKGDDGRWLHGVDPKTKKTEPDLNWDIPCAELCGWGHYRMIGKVYVHQDQKDFLDWLKSVEENPTPVASVADKK